LSKYGLLLFVITVVFVSGWFIAINITKAADRRNVFKTNVVLDKIRSQVAEFRRKTGNYPSNQEISSIVATKTDSWGYRLQYVTWTSNETDHFRVASPGKDGMWQHSDLRAFDVYLNDEKWDPNFDIVCGEGGFVQTQILE
jgi:hypothetical protein